MKLKDKIQLFFDQSINDLRNAYAEKSSLLGEVELVFSQLPQSQAGEFSMDGPITSKKTISINENMLDSVNDIDVWKMVITHELCHISQIIDGFWQRIQAKRLSPVVKSIILEIDADRRMLAASEQNGESKAIERYMLWRFAFLHAVIKSDLAKSTKPDGIVK